MANEILVSGASEILKKVSSMVAQEIGAAWGVKGELKKLEKSSTMIQAFLGDAEKRQMEEDSVKLWLRRLKQVYHDADDVLDEFAYEHLRRQMTIKNRFQAKVRNFFSLANPIAFRFKMAHKIKDINSALAEIEKDVVTVKLNAIITTPIPHQYTSDRNTTSRDVKITEIVGRETEKITLVNQLIDTRNQEADVVSVLSVVGVGGLGKTALVQLIYNEESVEKFFDLRIWVCVSELFDVERILRNVIESITKSKCDLSNMDAIVRNLQEKISGKRYLLVLDDVWNEEFPKWDRLYAVLSRGAGGGSKLIVTTRSSKVASIVGPPETQLHLKNLPEEECWLLFKLRAFREGRQEMSPNIIEIGKNIVRKCGGVPLMVIHLGCIMQSKNDEREWLYIRDSNIWDLPENQKIIGVLKLSYDNLLSPIKQCFSYCAIFPKDALIKKFKLIQMWTAEGFLEPPQGSTKLMDDMIGDDYFNALMCNSFFQNIERDQFGRICVFKMHDLVHDLACLVSKSDFCFENLETVRDVGQIRHVSSAPQVLKSLSPTNKVRTYMFPSTIPKSVKLEFGNELLKLKYLRVLDLNGAYITDLPASVGKLIHLRYLDLSGTFIETLPDSVCSLYHLQTLNLNLCEKLCELPMEMKNLIGLKHLTFYGTKLNRTPRHIGQLSSLQTLSKFIVGEEGSGCSIRELKNLNLEGELRLSKLEMVRSGAVAKEANLDQKSNLLELELKWSKNCNVSADDVLEGLQPHSNLKRLEVSRFLGYRFPRWMNASFLPNLMEMNLISCACEHLPSLGQLKFLRVLWIVSMTELRCIGDEFYGDIGTQEVGCNLFPSLRALYLNDLPKLEEWMEPPNSCFPLLEILDVVGCKVLTKTPGQFPSLKFLRVFQGSESLVRSLSCKTSSLTFLDIAKVIDMKYLPQGLLQRNNLLQELNLLECPEIRSIPVEELKHLRSLVALRLTHCKSLTVEPDLISCLTSLRGLFMVGVKEMESSSLSQWLRNFPLLCELGIGGFTEEPNVFPMIEGIEQIDSLVSLTICGWPKLTALPEQLQHLTRLQGLHIMNFEGLVALPNWLANLSSLKSLYITKCENLKYLPQCLSSSISFLQIVECPLLKERCTSMTGEEWSKIAHIPFRFLFDFK